MTDETGDSQTALIDKDLDSIRKRLLTLDWDKKHNQLNAGMESSYNELKAKFKELEEQKQKIKSS
jgi:hypothetical protein